MTRTHILLAVVAYVALLAVTLAFLSGCPDDDDEISDAEIHAWMEAAQ
jgi:hypothetical protein